MIKAVLFDFHNTLATCDGWLTLEIETLPGRVLERLGEIGVIPQVEAAHKEQAEQLFRALRRRVRESGVEISALEGARHVLGEMGYSAVEPYLDGVVAALEEEELSEVRPVPGADTSVLGLHRAGYRLGVVSSAGYPLFVDLALERLGLRSVFSTVLTSAGEGIYKSNPEIYRRAAERLGVQPHEAVHVGDHPLYDVGAAKAAGLKTIWFTGEARRTAHLHGTPWEEHARPGAEADESVESMGDVYEAVLRLSSPQH